MWEGRRKDRVSQLCDPDRNSRVRGSDSPAEAATAGSNRP